MSAHLKRDRDVTENQEGLTLASWAAGVWYRHRRGVQLGGHEAAIVYCMEYHREWRAQWDSLGTSNDPDLSRDVLHVHYDAMVKMQIDSNDPPEIREGYQKLRDREFTEFEALHTFIPALSETLWIAQTKKTLFDRAHYIKLAQDYVNVALHRPTFVRRWEK
jgi:hypothetical protein